MARPAKSASVLSLENRSHRTKKEIEIREKGEKSMLTNRPMQARIQTRKNDIAYNEFLRIEALYDSIGKNDAMYESSVNLYCIIYAECIELEHQKNHAAEELFELERDKEKLLEEGGIYLAEYYQLKEKLKDNILKYDRNLMVKRKMLFDMDKEGGMTLASALRIIPKQADKEENPLIEALTLLNCSFA